MSFPCLKPIDAEKIAELTRRFRHIVTVEEHSIVGGFGSAVCEVAAETGNPCRIHRIGMEDVYSTIVGTQQYLRAQYQMDDEAIARRGGAVASGGIKSAAGRKEAVAGRDSRGIIGAAAGLTAVCKKHNISYNMMCGSLLGAVRHKASSRGMTTWIC